MRKFDSSFLRNGSIPADLIDLLTGIYSVKTSDAIRKRRFTTVYSDLEKIARVQSVKGSNAIEGIVTTDERIQAIVNQNSGPLNDTEQGIAGDGDVVNVSHTSDQD